MPSFTISFVTPSKVLSFDVPGTGDLDADTRRMCALVNRINESGFWGAVDGNLRFVPAGTPAVVAYDGGPLTVPAGMTNVDDILE